MKTETKQINRYCGIVLRLLSVLISVVLLGAIYLSPLDIHFYSINLTSFFSLFAEWKYLTIGLVMVILAMVWRGPKGKKSEKHFILES